VGPRTKNGRQAVARTKQENQDQPTLRQVVGANLRILRQARDLSQEELGNEVEPYLGHRLTKQMVSLLEAGKRSLDLEELLAVYHVLLYPLDTMLRIGWKGTPLHDDDFIRLESGHSLPVRMVRGFIRGRQKGPESELLDVVIPPGEEDAEPLMALHELGGVRRLLAALGQMSDSERVELFGLAEQMDSGERVVTAKRGKRVAVVEQSEDQGEAAARDLEQAGGRKRLRGAIQEARPGEIKDKKPSQKGVRT
jgi:transcriptional regulator with XRE-family HTH domain